MLIDSKNQDELTEKLSKLYGRIDCDILNTVNKYVLESPTNNKQIANAIKTVLSYVDIKDPDDFIFCISELSKVGLHGERIGHMIGSYIEFMRTNDNLLISIIKDKC